MGILFVVPGYADDGFPRTVADALGRQVEIPARPQRIVAIFASNVEILDGIGAGDRIVGVESFTRYPPHIAERAKVGGRLGFSIEAIARLKADLVVMTPARQAANMVDPLQRIGIPALVLNHRDLNMVMENIRLLGTATGNESEAAQLIAGLESRIAAVRQRLQRRSPVRVYLETAASDRGTYLSVRDGTYTADILRLAGGKNALAGSTLSQVGGESVLRAAPAHIILAGPPERIDTLAKRPGWETIDAVRDGKVSAMPSALLLIPGPRVVDGVEQLARQLHPDAFGKQTTPSPRP
ncbi:Fe3+-hydroxamate ABC transporter substrate-binding protein [Stutzerimonas stutzeri]|uniref:Fe3+-hydroxamate ABC transporter substrate-binding protein n=1 Tax=Stutzerimonas stutzeri TaxID=316 RepID=A0A2S4AU96_STUST|nr:Fe3+-hydroxamate ABC transporter substrate-binding protein [Stutzerimonas stutzeri]